MVNEPPRRAIALDHFFQPRLEDRDFAAFQFFNFFGNHVQTNNLIPEVCKARAGHKTNIANANNGNTSHLKLLKKMNFRLQFWPYIK